jgi:ribose transport system ATP-binding protein
MSAAVGAPPAIVFDGIRRGFFGVPVLKDVSLALPAGHVLGLIGENGAGKSTLMNILGGVLPPDAGTLRLHGEPYAPSGVGDATAAGVAFIHQELNLFTNLSIAENLVIDTFPRLGRTPLTDRRAVREHARRQLERVELEIDPGTLVERLSVGERQLVEIAKALGGEARVIIFDEPTTSLTARESERLFALIHRLRGEGRSMIYISHVLGDVERLCDDIVVLRDGSVVGAGPQAEFPIPRMISLMVGRSIDQLFPERAIPPSDEPVLEVEGVSQTGVVKDIGFRLHRREVLGVFGLMGSGRTELARIVFGLDPHETGSVAVAGRTLRRRSPRRSIRSGMAFVTENRRDEGLLMDISIAENMALASLRRFARSRTGLVDRGRLGAFVERTAEALQIRSSGLRSQPARALSGGNQQKVVIGKWLATEPEVLLLDEPTRGVDVGARFQIYTIVADLAARGTGVLMISSELDELMGVCDRIIVMARGELAGEFTRDDFDAERILAAAFGEGGEQE